MTGLYVVLWLAETSLSMLLFIPLSCVALVSEH